MAEVRIGRTSLIEETVMSEMSCYRWSLIDKISEFIFWVVLPSCIVFAICLWVTHSQVAAAYSGGVTFGFMALWLWRTTSKRRNAKRTEQKDVVSDGKLVKSLWNSGASLFSADWVLMLSVEVPKVVVSGSTVGELKYKLEVCYWQAKAAVTYFPDGTYFVGRDGSMSKLSDAEAKRLLSGTLQISTAKIDFGDLPYAETIARRLAKKPATPMEVAKNCVLLDVHAHGKARKHDGTEFNCMPRFAARDGKIIVESY